MNLKKLQNHIRALATLDETSEVVISCYLNLENGGVANREFFQNRLNRLRIALPKARLSGFEEATGSLCDYLDTELLPESGGLAAFARGGDSPLFLALQFQVPLPDWISVGAFPNIFHLVELKDTYHRFIILISTEEKARILEITLGEVTQELWRERPELQERIERGWSKEKYQRYRRHHDERFFREKIEVLEKLMAQGGHKHFILAGNPRLTRQIRNLLPKHLADKFIDSVSTAAGDQVSDVVKTAINVFIEEEERESREVVENLMDEFYANGLGVLGISSAARALHEARADVLVIAKNFETDAGWRCPQCHYIGEKYQLAEECSECGWKDIDETDLKEEMIRLAEKHGCRIEVVNNDDRLIGFQGVGALLRFSEPEQNYS